MTLVVRQVVFPSPACNLLRLPVWSSVAILPPAIALVQEPLVVALQLVVQDHAIHSAALLSKALLGARVGAIDLRVVRQFTRLSEARVERLLWLPGAVLSLTPIRFEQVSTAVGKEDRSVVGAECGRAEQTLLFEVALGSAGVPATIVEIALGHDAEGTNDGEHAAFGAVDFVRAIAFSNWPALTAAWQVEVLCDHVARVTIGRMIAFAAAATAASAAVAEIVAIAFTRRAWVVSVEHRSSPTRLVSRTKYQRERLDITRLAMTSQLAFGASRIGSVAVGCPGCITERANRYATAASSVCG
jgi:hypothetical protein